MFVKYMRAGLNLLFLCIAFNIWSTASWWTILIENNHFLLVSEAKAGDYPPVLDNVWTDFGPRCRRCGTTPDGQGRLYLCFDIKGVVAPDTCRGGGGYSGVDNGFDNFAHIMIMASCSNPGPTVVSAKRWVQNQCATNSPSIWDNLAVSVGNPDNFGPPDCGPSGPSCLTGNPIDARSGNKFQLELDFVGSGEIGVWFARYYNSLDRATRGPSVASIGSGWRNNWNLELQIIGFGGISLHDPKGFGLLGAEAIYARRLGGKVFKFQSYSNNVYLPAPDVRLTLTPEFDAKSVQVGWKLVTADGTVERYTLVGRIISFTTPAGLETKFSYDSTGQLYQVTGPFGHKMTFTYDSNQRISKMTAPDNGVYTYAYDTAGNLATVTYPDGAIRRYVYEDVAFPTALTGIVDERSVRYASWIYDQKGLATSSERAGGTELNELSYAADGSTTVQDARGYKHKYNFTTQFGRTKLTSITGTPVKSVNGKMFDYDANGFLASRTDWLDIVTNYKRDLRGNETSRTEAAGTASARTITTDWHATFNLPTKITEPGRVTDLTYDTKGNLLTRKITAGSRVRTWNYTYSPVGQKLTETDPRGSVTTFTYDAQGNLASVKNALGQITQFTKYDGAGRVLRSVDPNGLETTYAYDLRGRLTSQTVGALKTIYTYDLTGNLTKVTAPDNSFRTFSYDDAHRLIGVVDALGNRVAYTLDAASNKTAAVVFNASNVQVRAKTFTYDNVNRVLTAAGVSGPKETYTYDLRAGPTNSDSRLSGFSA